jgi:hypothetical protein
MMSRTVWREEQHRLIDRFPACSPDEIERFKQRSLDQE